MDTGAASLRKFGWVVLVLCLTVSTFGTWFSFVLVIYTTLFAAGFALVIGYWGFTQSQEIRQKTHGSDLGFPARGLDNILLELQQSRKPYKLDKRLTGSSIIDEPLQEVLQLFFRDYVHSWYYTISAEEEFLHDLRNTLQRALIAFANRSKDVEWVTFLTTRFVDDITNHLKIYRKAKEALDRAAKSEDEDNSSVEIETLFFQTEHKMEGDICRDKICMSEEAEYGYLCDISEVLLFLLLPPEDFHNKPFRYFFREIIARCVLVPTVAMICDPDYINQTIAWLCKDSTFTREAFLTIIREGLSSIDDVEAVRDKVDMEIAKLRAHDSETTEAADAAVRQQLGSLLFVRRMCEAKIQTLTFGHGEVPVFPPEQPDLGKLIVPSQPVPRLPLQTILDNNTALSYFIEFMNGANGQVYLYFWLAVEGYRVAAEQQLCVTAEQQMALQEQTSSSVPGTQGSGSSRAVDLEEMRSAALSVFEQYLADSSEPRVVLPKDLVKQIHKKITKAVPSPDQFDAAQSQVYEILGSEKFYGAFLNSQTYLRCLLDLDILKEKSDDGSDAASGADEDETRTIGTEATQVEDSAPQPERLWTPDDDVRLNASITEVGLSRDSSGRSFAVYSVSVFRATAQGTQSWVVCRRYSDFDNLHLHLKEKFGSLEILFLPAKKTFHNMDKKFLEKRRLALDSYLQVLLSSDILGQHPGMFETVFSFLEPGEYTREKMQFARKLVAPIRNVSHAIKTVPGGVQKIFKPGAQRGRELKEDFRQAAVEFDPEEEENIPLRILLLLMDEIFDLKDRNLWLRRRIVVLLRQIIKTTFGDRINRKIVDFVDLMTSAEQIAEYVKVFRDSFWPGGVLAETPPERQLGAKKRTRVAAKTKMYGSTPEELNRFMGTDVTMAGVCRVFDTFQHTSFNKRLFYVLWEGILEQLFPDNKFNEIFRKIHAKAK